MTADLPEPLLAYFAQREQQRAAAVAAFLDSLSDYERGLFYDAAVMGYVRGSMHPQGEEIPLKAAIVADVVNACFAHSDLYPAVNAEFEERRVVVDYFLQCQQDDGTWETASSYMDALDWATERLAGKRAKFPDFTWRLARRTTTVTVEAQRNEQP
ncbi:hypothetical protein [Streptomyces sp. bgisy022]|uniref:hypothetical protein n=1 Tax=Streptomyces sp. bgisy022 TaxID=3413769 RepID=UPI003D741EAD